MRRTLLLIALCALPSVASAHTDWWLGEGAAAGGGGGLADVVDDTSPTLGGDLDGQAFNITTTGDGFFDDITVDVLTYNSAVSTCTGTGCGSQLPLVAGTPDNADSGTIRLYNWSTFGLSVYGDAGFLGFPMLNDGAGGAAVGAIPRALDADAIDYEASGITIDATDVIKEVVAIWGTATGYTRFSNYVFEDQASCLAPGLTDYALCLVAGSLRLKDSASSVSLVVQTGAGGAANNAIARFSASGGELLDSEATATMDTNGNINATSFESGTSTGKILVTQDNTFGGKIGLPEGADGGGANQAVLSLGNAINLSADVTVGVLSLPLSVPVATGARGAVVGAVSNGGTFDTAEELCSVQYSEASGPVVACVAGSAKKYAAAGVPADVVDLIACGDTVESGVYFEAVCNVEN